MTTEDLLRNTYKIQGNNRIDYTKDEILDRRRLLRKILAGSKFSQCTNSQLDNLTAINLPDGKYIIRDWDNYEWLIQPFRSAKGAEEQWPKEECSPKQ